MQISIANIIRGTLIGNTMSVLTRYISRVVNGGGIVEAPQCVETALNSQPLLGQASLVLIPSGYKEDVVYSEIPTNGNGDLSFTRASSATRVNSAGLIEKVRTNLALYSNTFSNAVWSVIGTPTLTANYDTNPLTGANDAWRFVAAGVGDRLVQNTSGSNSAFSLYVKGTGQIVIRDNTGTYSFNATLTSSWQRIVVSIPAALTNVQLTGGSGGCDATIYAAQLESGDIATDYIPTTSSAVSVGMTANVPRLTYQNGGGGCPSLLLEPQRTNLLFYSEQFDNAYWTKTGVTISANATTSPDGNLTADKLVENSVNGNHFIWRSQSNFTPSVNYWHSWYVKAGERYKVRIQDASYSDFFASYNLNTGSLIDEGTSTMGNTTITPLLNGWYRLTLASNQATTARYPCIILLPDNYTAGDGISYQGNGTSGVFIWGAQLEAGAYPTTYIPTTSSTATRVADACSKTGISSLIGQSEGTIFVDLVITGTTGNNRFSISDGSNTNWIFIGTPEDGGNRTSRFYIKTNGSVAVDVGTSSYFTFGQRYKLALAYKSGDWAVYGNGILLYSGTTAIASVSSPLSVFNFFNATGGVCDAAELINQALLFKTRLTNSELAQLTGNQNYTINQAYASYGVASESPNCVQP
jgi:hypothetical protein